MLLRTLLGGGEARANVSAGTHVGDPALAKLFGRGQASEAGIAVDADSSLRNAAVFASVRVVGETIASLPVKLKQRQDGARTDRDDLPLAARLAHQPNGYQTSFEWREMGSAHLELRGNAFSAIARNNAGQVAALIPMHPDRVTVFWAPDGRRAYNWQPPNGPAQTLLQSEVHHVAGLGFDGLVGMSPIAYMRDAVGLALATERYGARFFANDSRPGGYLRHPGNLSSEAQANLIASWEERHRGSPHRVDVLEEGMEFKEVGVAPEDAQFLETRKFQTAEIARIFRVPPHLIGDLDKATFSNIEHQAIEFVVHSIRPRLVRMEQAMRRDLLTDSARRDGVFVKFVVDGLLRGDTKSRYEAYQLARQNGFMNADEIREMEDMDPIGGDAGAEFWRPGNMGLAGREPMIGANAGPGREPGSRGLPLLPVLDAAAERIAAKEVQAARRALAKADGDPAAFAGWARDFYAGHAEFVAKAIGCADDLAERYATRRRNVLLAAGGHADAVLAEWEADRGQDLAGLVVRESLERDRT